jgi:nucleoside 2-deoxyribosyltransferase
MTIYLAGSYSARLELNKVAKLLEAKGHNIRVPAIWLTGQHDDACPIECATTDLKDIHDSDMLILFTIHQGSRGGMYTELGIALANHIPVVIIGPYTNVFTRLCRRVDSIDELLNERTR